MMTFSSKGDGERELVKSDFYMEFCWEDVDFGLSYTRLVSGWSGSS